MKHIIGLLLLLSSIFAVEWVDLETAVKRSFQEQKLIMIFVYEGTCKACMQVNTDIKYNAELNKAMNKVVPVMMSVQEVASKYRMFATDQTPTFFFTNSQLKLFSDPLRGYPEPYSFARYINQSADFYKQNFYNQY